MKTYTVVSETIITRTYTIEAESEERAIEIVQDNPNDYDDEDLNENWNAIEY